MLIRTNPALLLVALLALPHGGCVGGVRAEAPGAGKAADLIVRRGDLHTRMLLTGELAAAQAEHLEVPRTQTWQLQVRWLEQDGVAVRKGQKLVELDNSTFTAELEEKKLSVSEAEKELVRTEAEAHASTAEKEFTVQQKRTDLDKAQIAAAIPSDLLAEREYQERQLAVRRAQVEVAKAEDDLAAQVKGSAADLEVRRIALEKSRREIRQAEAAIRELTLTAPRDGIFLVADHPWEGRKLHEGDTAFVGMTVATLPDLSSLIVKAALSDVDDGRVTPGMEVLCTLDAYPGETFHGKVADVAAVAQETPRRPLLRSFPVSIRLDRTDPQRMRPGMSVRVEVLGKDTRNVLLAPRAGLDFAANPPRARLARGGTAEVRLGACSAADCVVESGLREGERLR
ncbi:MAG TPA: efflux RND transporter periplasmic adaptor subunit [Thermoanaerobaculia bacterium]|nr:efflux RND transporter periplasmic adaptor subunit [Thermoanaerobaculia bacterium]